MQNLLNADRTTDSNYDQLVTLFNEQHVRDDDDYDDDAFKSITILILVIIILEIILDQELNFSAHI